MESSDLDTMRKSISTVKKRSGTIKDSASTKRLIKRVQEIKKFSIENNEELLNQALESFKRNDIDFKIADSSALAIMSGMSNCEI